MPKNKKQMALPADDGVGPSDSGEAEMSSVVYIGHIPHGFFEAQMMGFFSQFGKVTKVRLSRNKKDARSKGYAFIEFKYPEVAVIAAEAMNGYFLFKQKLVSRVLKQSEVHPALFKGANKKMKSIPWAKLEADRHNKPRTPEEHAKRMARLLRKDERRREQIAKAGIDYEYEGLQAQVPSQPKKITFK